jgi:DNA-binding CsgD family transcriptional regulator
MRLDLADVQALAGLLEGLYAIDDPARFPGAVVAAARALVAGTAHAYNEVDRVEGRALVLVEPAHLMTPARQATFDGLLGEHPIIARHAETGDGSAVAISDLMDRDAFRATRLYRALYREIGGEDQIAISAPTPSLVVGVAINRDSWGFSERDRLVLDLVRPHLAQAHRNAAELALARQALALSGAAVVRLDRDGRIAEADDRARAALATAFDAWAASSAGLPHDLAAWAAEQAGRLATDPGVPLAPLVVEGSRARLTARYVPATPYSGACIVVRVEERGVSADVARRYGLSARERDVVRLLAEGATDGEMAAALVISRHTVHRHLQHIYAKLGVRSRSAALAKLRASG